MAVRKQRNISYYWKQTHHPFHPSDRYPPLPPCALLIRIFRIFPSVTLNLHHPDNIQEENPLRKYGISYDFYNIAAKLSSARNTSPPPYGAARPWGRRPSCASSIRCDACVSDSAEFLLGSGGRNCDRRRRRNAPLKVRPILTSRASETSGMDHSPSIRIRNSPTPQAYGSGTLPAMGGQRARNVVRIIGRFAPDKLAALLTNYSTNPKIKKAI